MSILYLLTIVVISLFVLLIKTKAKKLEDVDLFIIISFLLYLYIVNADIIIQSISLLLLSIDLWKNINGHSNR